MTYSLTSDELKIAESGSVDFSKFTDSSKGYQNITYEADKLLKGVTFTVQDAVDSGFTLSEAETLLDSLITKKAIIELFTLSYAQSLDTTALPYIADCLKNKTVIGDKYLFLLTEDFINHIAKS